MYPCILDRILFFLSHVSRGTNLVRGQEFRGRQFAQAGKIASDFLGNIIKHEQDLENQRINNKVINLSHSIDPLSGKVHPWVSTMLVITV